MTFPEPCVRPTESPGASIMHDDRSVSAAAAAAASLAAEICIINRSFKLCLLMLLELDVWRFGGLICHVVRRQKGSCENSVICAAAADNQEHRDSWANWPPLERESDWTGGWGWDR